jgi:2-polyprenyl-3-methyl-5-hydroxy-6-metoxy-1,4-benzoquinol methylase
MMEQQPVIDHSNLEEFQDPVNYDIEETAPSAERIAFYCDLASDIGGPVLEIACGTGIVAIPVAQQGLAVTGLDLARPMLEHARLKTSQAGLNIDWVEADGRQFELGKQFRFIYITGNAFQAFLRREDQEALLLCVRRHLLPDGIFAFDTRNPSGHSLNDQFEEETWFSYTSIEGHNVTVSGIQAYDALAQVLHWTSYRRWNDGKGEQTRVTRIACRFTYPQELAALLHYNGLEIVRQYGNWQKAPLAAESSSIITLCKLSG